MTSSITFNIGAPTFGVREQSSRFYGVNHTTEFPKWNDAKINSPMIQKTNHLVKPSSNTLNVGVPTFSVKVLALADSRVLAGLKPSGYKPLYVGAGLQPGQPYFSLAVAQ
jgi:hypothetical protein